MLKIFGIRHHGSGSAQSLQLALEQFQPDCILIESPADAEAVLPYAADPDIKLPVAILMYNPNDLQQASYLPFAAFSPEWVTFQFGFQNHIPIRFMDLPMGIQFSLEKEPQAPLFQTGKNDFQNDPLGQMAQLAGYTDSERWWEITFEQVFSPIEIFDQIENMITALRDDQPDERLETLRREAYMRTVLRKAIKDGFERIAVVCGAWHVPALANFNKFKTTADKSLLKGLKKINTRSTWIPWSYERLAVDSGYGAGIKSPAWYDLIFHFKKSASVHWMSKVANLLRLEGMDASVANSVEAVRLAETLATLQHRELPEITDLLEAAIAVFANGNPEPIKWIERRLIIGEQYGEVPPSIPMVPLQKDIEAAIKTARLTKEHNSIEVVEKKLDLRKETHLGASYLLHRLSILEIPWGRPLPGSEFSTGSFTEIWSLKWLPDFAIQIIEAGMWGNTAQEAASNKLIKKASEEKSLAALASLVAEGLLADTPHAVPVLIVRLREISSLTGDAIHLLEALPTLVSVLRYGSVRKTDTDLIRAVVEEFVPRLSIALPSACVSMDEECSNDIFSKILAANHALSILQNKLLLKGWHQSLQQLIEHPGIHSLLKGAAARMLFNKQKIDEKQIATQMRYALSFANQASESAAWLEGFLHGSGLLLIHNPIFWNILDEWIGEIPIERFKNILPLLRRTFSRFPPPERQKMMELAKKVEKKTTEENLQASESDSNIEPFLPVARLLLG